MWTGSYKGASMCSRGASSVAVVLALGSTARADDRVEIPFQPRVAATLSNGQQFLEAGVECKIGGAPRIEDATSPGDGTADITTGRVFASVLLPFGTGTVVRVDKDTPDWRISLGGDLAHATRREPKTADDLDHSRSRYGFSLALGHADFTYFPGAGTEPLVEGHWSASATARAIWIHAKKSELWAPQIAVTYDRSYSAGSQVGIVSPATMDEPPLVTRMVSIAAPAASPTLAARVSCPYALWPDSQFLIGPSLSHAFAGMDRSYSPFDGAGGRFEGELWFYYFPKLDPGVGATNVRIGVAPFATVRTYGDDGQAGSTYGALAELRINSEIFDY